MNHPSISSTAAQDPNNRAAAAAAGCPRGSRRDGNTTFGSSYSFVYCPYASLKQAEY